MALYALLVFQVSYAADIKHWLGGFLALTVPVAFVANIFFLVTYIFYGSWKFVLSLLILVAGYPLIERTLKFSLNQSKGRQENKLSVLSYNVMYCGGFEEGGSTEGTDNSRSLVNDLDTISADIKCFQELYNQPKHEFLNVFAKLSKSNPYHTHMHSTIEENSSVGAVGLAIFSKFPIIHKEEISWKTNNNGVLIADVIVHSDTIRIFNVQFKSMGIRVMRAITRDEVTRNKEARNILSQLKSGFQDRAVQVDTVEELIAKSPHPVIVAGDFNELPYGYAYGRVRKHLDNAFEASGFGFGFTYHKMPSFLRIDNQFFNEKYFDILNFETFRDLTHSDHYPIWASYKIRK